MSKSLITSVAILFFSNFVFAAGGNGNGEGGTGRVFQDLTRPLGTPSTPDSGVFDIIKPLTSEDLIVKMSFVSNHNWHSTQGVSDLKLNPIDSIVLPYQQGYSASDMAIAAGYGSYESSLVSENGYVPAIEAFDQQNHDLAFKFVNQNAGYIQFAVRQTTPDKDVFTVFEAPIDRFYDLPQKIVIPIEESYGIQFE